MRIFQGDVQGPYLGSQFVVVDDAGVEHGQTGRSFGQFGCRTGHNVGVQIKHAVLPTLVAGGKTVMGFSRNGQIDVSGFGDHVFTQIIESQDAGFDYPHGISIVKMPVE